MEQEDKEPKDKEIIHRIDHSQIKEGEIVYQGGVYDSNGNYLKPIPYLKNAEEIKKENLNMATIPPPKKIDVSEFSEKDDLEELDRFIPLSVRDILNMKFPRRQFLIEKLIPQKSICVLSGYPSSGKSWILLHLSQCIASGKPLFGEFKSQKGAVLIIDEESGIEEFVRRIKKMKLYRRLPIYVYPQRGIKIDDPINLLKIIGLIKERNIKLVILDPFIATHSKIENSAEDMQKVMESFQKINLAGATVLFAHHHRKELITTKLNPAQALRGSSAIFGRVDSHLEVKKLEEKESGIVLAITHVKSRRSTPVLPFKVKMTERYSKAEFEFCGEYDERKRKEEETESLVLATLGEIGKADFSEVLGKLKGSVGEIKLRFILKDLKKKGAINSEKKEHGREVFWKEPTL
jgi:archaellum biogenesis ATPase FlaH